jgi:hypothetical protein
MDHSIDDEYYHSQVATHLENKGLLISHSIAQIVAVVEGCARAHSRGNFFRTRKWSSRLHKSLLNARAVVYCLRLSLGSLCVHLRQG